MTLNQFFTRYAELSLGTQPQALASLYAPTFIVGGPKGSQAFTNDASFLQWIQQVAAFNRDHGMRAMEVIAIRDTNLSSIHALATVTWGATFKKTGDRVIEFDISYLLEKAEDEWRILSYISEKEQDEEMAKAGLL